MSKLRNLPQKTTPAASDLMYLVDSASGPNGGRQILYSNLRAATLPTAGETKSLYEANPNSNAFTDAYKSKLDGIEAGATVDQIASGVPYSNTTSGLTSSNVQTAIDELATEASLKPTIVSGLIMHYSAGTARFDGTFFSIPNGDFLLNPNVTNGYVYLDLDGIIKQTASGVLPPPFSIVLALFTTNATSVTSFQDQRVTNSQSIIRSLLADITDVNAGDPAMAGATGRVADAGHQHWVITASAVAIGADQASAEGVGTALARADHVHNIATGPAVSVGSANAQGAASTFSKSDHTHQGVHSLKVNSGTARYADINIKQGVGTIITDDGAGDFLIETNGGPNELYVSQGTGLSINYTAGKARFEGQYYSIPASVLAIAPNITVIVYIDVDGTVKSTTATQSPAGTVPLAQVVTGASAITSITDRRVFLSTSRIGGTPVTLTPDQANASGASNSYARADHIHDIPSGTPVATSTVNAKGSAAAFALADHTHNTALSNVVVSETADTTTVSLTDTQLGGMTMTPTAGTWLFLFNASVTNSANGSTRNYVNIYKGGVIVSGTERQIGISGTTDVPVYTQCVLALDGATAVNVNWRVVGGTGTCHQRNFIAIRIG